MGTANKIPGVSGGLVAIAIGFYEELVFSLKKIDRKALQFLFSGKLARFYNHINGQFLILILLGIVISYFSTSKLLDFLLERYEIYVWSLFFGLVIGTVYHLKKKIDSWTRENIIILFFGIIIGVGISIMNPASENDNIFFVDSNVLKSYEKDIRYFRFPYKSVHPHEADYMLDEDTSRNDKIMKDLNLTIKPWRKEGKHICLFF